MYVKARACSATDDTFMLPVHEATILESVQQRPVCLVKEPSSPTPLVDPSHPQLKSQEMAYGKGQQCGPNDSHVILLQ